MKKKSVKHYHFKYFVHPLLPQGLKLCKNKASKKKKPLQKTALKHKIIAADWPQQQAQTRDPDFKSAKGPRQGSASAEFVSVVKNIISCQAINERKNPFTFFEAAPDRVRNPFHVCNCVWRPFYFSTWEMFWISEIYFEKFIISKQPKQNYNIEKINQKQKNHPKHF